MNVRPLAMVAELSGPMAWSVTSTPAIVRELIWMGGCVTFTELDELPEPAERPELGWPAEPEEPPAEDLLPVTLANLPTDTASTTA